MRPHDYAPRPAHIKWLLDSDPAIRWQVLRDLTDASADVIASERSLVATEGWGAKLLALQSPTGRWNGGRQWDLTTLYSLTALKDFGLDPASKPARKMIGRVKKHLKFKPLNNRPYLHAETEPCINGRILGLGAYFDEPNDTLAQRLLSEQLADGGWNCEAPKVDAPPSTPLFAYSKACSSTSVPGANPLRSRMPVSAAKTIYSSAACSAHCAPKKSSTNAGYGSPIPPFGTTTFCVAWIICVTPESSLTSASVKPSTSS